MTLIHALILIFILAVFALVVLLALIRIFKPNKRKVPAHQIVKRANDPLPYQEEGYWQISNGDWKLDEATGKYTQTLEDGTVVTWDNDPSGQVAAAKQMAEWGERVRNQSASDEWMRRVNK